MIDRRLYAEKSPVIGNLRKLTQRCHPAALERRMQRVLGESVIQYSRVRTTGWTPVLAISTILPMERDFHIRKLADEFGQYVLYLKCESCLHERRTTPHMLANLCGWNANLADVVRRLRCSICGQKKCAARAVPITPPRGYKKH
jgi:hypothetical protein